MKPRLLIVDDEESLLEMLCLFFTEQDFEVRRASSAEQARERLAAGVYDVVLCDIMMPDGNGLQLLKEIKAERPQTAVVMMTAYPSDQAAVEAMKSGAYNYVAKPFHLDELSVQITGALEKTELEAENVYLRRELEQKYQFSNIVGKSSKMREIFTLIERVARTLSTVLIQGESGTGKELIARAIHFSSPRADHRFQSVNCGAMPENLLESELFGHQKGAFTGAIREKKGLFHEADKGTLFLDEISEMTPTMQVKLLRALQDKQIRRVGGNREEPVDVRIIAATNKDLSAAIDDGSFREDLYYRINVIPIDLPPLRHRREDIPLLIGFFVRKYGEELGVETLSISREARLALENYAWPGNVRELENTIERALALSTSEHLTIQDLPLQIRRGGRPPLDVSELPEEGLDLERHLDEIRQHLMQQALERADGVQTRAAELLEMTFRSFRYYAKKLGLTGGAGEEESDGTQREPIET